MPHGPSTTLLDHLREIGRELARAIGAGQCGLAMSACLLDAGREQIVLERGQVAQAWRERWDSLTLLSPNWFTRLPKYSYSGDDPN